MNAAQADQNLQHAPPRRPARFAIAVMQRLRPSCASRRSVTSGRCRPDLCTSTSSKGPIASRPSWPASSARAWPDDLSARLDILNGLPGALVSGPDGLVQTMAFEIEDGVIKAIYVVRNPDKLRHLA